MSDIEKVGSAKPKAEPKRWEHREEFMSLLPFLWPTEEPRLKVFIVLAFLCLLAAKGLNICVPLALKAAVDAASEGRMPLTPVVCYGLFRFLTDGTKEIRDSLFNYSATYASRKISLRVFNHLQQLSLRFHLNRKTGAVLRAVSRGSAAYADLLRYISFQIAPILLEVSLVSTYLVVRYSPAFGAITVTVMILYIATTIIVTEWRNKYRRLATEADDAFNQKAVDALLNFETVLLFCAQDHISEMYDQSLQAVAAASIDSQLSLSLLNILQNAVISFGVALAMALAGREVVAGTMSIGDFGACRTRLALRSTAHTCAQYLCRCSSYSCTPRLAFWGRTGASRVLGFASCAHRALQAHDQGCLGRC